MNRTERTPEVRGARDLAALWRMLPAAVLRYPAAALPPGLGLNALSDTLRARAWRDHCASVELTSCADAGRSCSLANDGRCQADVLFPFKIGGGSPAWRMATLAVQWRPALAELRLIALGEIAGRSLGWAARCLREHFQMVDAEPLPVATLADLELQGSDRWRLTFVTPWLVSKNPREGITAPDAATVAHELRKAMRIRAHKLTALCAQEETWQRLGAHLAHHVADALLPRGLTVEQADVTATPLPMVSRGNRGVFESVTWNGHATLRVEEEILPWLSLIATCGGGENADKGFGGIELSPLH
ncbi:MAG: hypothetical protein LM550_10790 [Candidatus Contendobacter sp.]|jgi:hypothetical protein|nr:hypothetical protein [Gammaproteobacteria bacterium]MCC8994150.1 hypothetical protein [Candidatus Contendobacter sp.]